MVWDEEEEEEEETVGVSDRMGDGVGSGRRGEEDSEAEPKLIGLWGTRGGEIEAGGGGGGGEGAGAGGDTFGVFARLLGG